MCEWFGITRQAYYVKNWKEEAESIEAAFIIKEVLLIRAKHAQIGTRKLYEMLNGFMQEHKIKMGRDAFFDLLSVHNLLIRRRKRRFNTTNSHHWLRKHPNLIRDFVPTAPNQLWVSDITYWKINDNQNAYISLITDTYSHKIVGYNVAETLETTESIKALKMSLASLNTDNLKLIHHSDRGVQYCSHAYVELLKSHKIHISMTENGDPLENAIAERVNGIIKTEYVENYVSKNISEAKKHLDVAVDLYNRERPHMSIGNLTPDQVYNSPELFATKKLWKNYYIKKEVPEVQI